jgi:hypothetical protein
MCQRVAASERDHWPTDGLDTVIAAGSGLPSSLDHLNCWLGSQRKAASDRYCELLAGGYIKVGLQRLRSQRSLTEPSTAEHSCNAASSSYKDLASPATCLCHCDQIRQMEQECTGSYMECNATTVPMHLHRLTERTPAISDAS